MDRNQLVIVTALALFAAFVLGWLAGLLVARLGRTPGEHLAEIDRLSRQLAQAEAARPDRIAEAEAARLQAELATARLEIEELRSYIDRQLGRT